VVYNYVSEEVHMNTVRVNITLPADVGESLRKVKNKSAFITEAIREKQLAEEKRKFKQKLEAAYKEAAAEDYEVYKDWEDTLKDGL
jgi:hypothetical protein